MAKVQTTAQNDIADALTWLAELFGGKLRDILLDIAAFFDRLTSDEAFRAQHADAIPQAFFDSECLGKAFDQLTDASILALLNIVNEIPVILTDTIACYAPKTGTEAQAVPQLDINFKCLMAATTTYFTTRDIGKTLTAFLSCQFSGSGGSGGGSGFGPNFQSVNRCS